MTMETIPDDLRRFILTSVPSVPYLEAVLVMRRERTRTWTAATLAQRLYVTESNAAQLLATAAQSGVAERDAQPAQGTFRYAPDESLAALIDRVAQAYSADLVGVTRLIHSRLDKRAQQFADAFRLRKD